MVLPLKLESREGCVPNKVSVIECVKGTQYHDLSV